MTASEFVAARLKLLEELAEQVGSIDHQHRNHGLNEIGFAETDPAFAQLFKTLYALQDLDATLATKKG